MNKCRIAGILTKTDTTFGSRWIYTFDVPRDQEGIDNLFVLSEDGRLPTGHVMIEGSIRAEYFRGKGMVIYIDPVDVQRSDETLSVTTVEGTIKNEVVPRVTKRNKDVCTLVLNTENGPIPVIIWGKSAKAAAGKYKTGDRVVAEGRLQSREYPLRTGERKVTYEISVGKNNPEVRKVEK